MAKIDYEYEADAIIDYETVAKIDYEADAIIDYETVAKIGCEAVAKFIKTHVQKLLRRMCKNWIWLMCKKAMTQLRSENTLASVLKKL